MIQSATRADAARSRRHYVSPHGAEAFVETYLGTNNGRDTASPNAYLVCQQPGATLHPHFHEADQFQVFLEGGGRIGTHTVGAVTVHYAAAHSPYGPVVAGPEGLQYLTLRRAWDPGAQWMPEKAARLRSMHGRKHRVFTSEQFPARADRLAPANTCAVTTLLQDDSMAAWVIGLGAGATWIQDTKADRFVYLLEGAVEVYGVALDAQSCLFASHDEREARFYAGSSGARVLLAQFN